MNPQLTLNLGVRYDKNHGADSAGNVVANDSAFSPRVGVVWDPKGDGKWTVSASVVEVRRRRSPTASPTPRRPPATRRRCSGPTPAPPINPDANAATLVGSAAAIQQMFDWCAPDSRGYCTVGAPSGTSLPGVSVKIPNGLASPNVLAYAVGVSRQLGSRAVVRADYSFRDYKDFYSQRIDQSTGTITDAFGNRRRSRARREHQRPEAPLLGRDGVGDLSHQRAGPTSAATTRCRGCGATSTARTSPAVR